MLVREELDELIFLTNNSIRVPKASRWEEKVVSNIIIEEFHYSLSYKGVLVMELKVARILAASFRRIAVTFEH